MDNSPFGKLSAELRNEIYSYVLPGKKPIQVFRGTGNVEGPLTRVCKKVRAECLLYLFANNTFTTVLGTGNSFLQRDRKDFAQRARAAAAWIRNISGDCNMAIPHLNVTCVATYTRNRGSMLGKTLQKLHQALEQREYEAERLQLIVEPQSPGSWSNASIEKLRQDSGFEKVVFKHYGYRYYGDDDSSELSD